MFNWEINAEKTVNTLPEKVWNLWIDVPNWPEWDKDLDWSRLDGKFELGTTGCLKPKGWFSSNFTISHIVPNQSFVSTTKMPFTKLSFSHNLKKINGTEVLIQHNLRVAGLLAPLLWMTMRFQLKKAIPEALENLVKKINIK